MMDKSDAAFNPLVDGLETNSTQLTGAGQHKFELFNEKYPRFGANGSNIDGWYYLRVSIFSVIAFVAFSIQFYYRRELIQWSTGTPVIKQCPGISNPADFIHAPEAYMQTLRQQNLTANLTCLEGYVEPFSIYLQRHRTKPLTILMKCVTNLVHPEGATVVMVIGMIMAKNKLQHLNFLAFAATMTYLSMILKSIYHEGRPYMINEDIIPLEKYAEYGNPSGHVLMGYIMITYFFEQFIWEHPLNAGYTRPTDQQKKLSRCLETFAHFVHPILVAGIFISRMYLGMHSFNQTLESLILGFFMQFIYNNVLHSLLEVLRFNIV